MRAVLVFNPIAGRGVAARVAHRLERALAEAGVVVDGVETGPGSAHRPLDELVGGAEVLAIVGGDGSVNRHLELAVRTGTPVWHVPAGTENLFAREWGMSAGPGQLIAAMERGVSTSFDVGVANGASFTTMCGVGFDANVVHRLSRKRSGAITRWSYGSHMLGEVVRPARSVLRVEVDGRVVADGVEGSVIVSNTRQYAARLDPSPRATPHDGQLDVAVLAHRSPFSLVKRAVEVRTRRKADGTGRISSRGQRVRVETLGRSAVVQVDGDVAMEAGGRRRTIMRTPLELSVRENAMRVLLPVGVSPDAGCEPSGREGLHHSAPQAPAGAP